MRCPFLFPSSPPPSQYMSPQTQYCLLSLHDINFKDTSYCLRPPSDTGVDMCLQENIQQFGILHPVLLQRKNKQHIILSGRKRIETAKNLALKKIPSLLIEERADPFQVCETILVHALIGSRLSLIEQAVFFSQIADKLQEAQAIALLPLLGFKPHPYKLEEFTTYLQLDQTAIGALHNGLIQPKTAIKLLKLSGEDQQTAVRLIDHFKLGGSKQHKLVDHAIELTMRTRLPLKDFVLQWEQEDQEHDNRPQQATALLNSLETQCFPNRTTAEKMFRQFQRSLQLPANITLQHTASFEDNRLTLSIVFDNQDMLLQGWEKIRRSL